MRLRKYLNENITTVEELNELIHKNCKYYLNITKGKYIFKRGMGFSRNIDPWGKWGKKKVRQNRKPRATDKDAFIKLNKWLDKNNHVRRDKAVMASSFQGEILSSFFGDLYWIFPIGKFNYTWIKSRDINLTDASTGWSRFAVDKYFERDGYVNDIKGDFKDYFVTNSSLKTAWQSQFEIWFDCKEYYYIKAKDYKWDIHTQTMTTKASIKIVYK